MPLRRDELRAAELRALDRELAEPSPARFSPPRLPCCPSGHEAMEASHVQFIRHTEYRPPVVIDGNRYARGSCRGCGHPLSRLLSEESP